MSLASNSMSTRVRPQCGKCSTPMMLARVTPKTPSIDEVTYDCRECNTSETVLQQR